MSATKEMTGADIVRESEKKPHEFSNAQIEGLQKKLAGRRLTFEDGKVMNVLKCSDHSAYGVQIVARFKSFGVDAYFPKSEAARLIETVDQGARIKSLEGRVMYPVYMATLLTLDDAKIIISE